MKDEHERYLGEHTQVPYNQQIMLGRLQRVQGHLVEAQSILKSIDSYYITWDLHTDIKETLDHLRLAISRTTAKEKLHD